MSEKSKGDVSSSSPARVVKNPLLSASVTGLTFDDFPNKPQLLPAAPPVVHTLTAHTTPSLIAGLTVNHEAKTLVTVGSTSAIDTDNLDEINLNASVEEPIVNANFHHSALEADGNANVLQGAGSDSILSQAASSFTALPAVASNVFSTFSKRIYANAASRESTPLQVDTQSTHTQQQFPQLQPQQQQQQPALQPAEAHSLHLNAPPPNLATPSDLQSAAVPDVTPPPLPEPPKLYTPTEVRSLPAANAATAPLTNVQNTYRFASKKKLYAPIPGLSHESQAPSSTQVQSPVFSQSTPINPPYLEQQANYQPTGLASQNASEATAATYEPKREERKGGLFSLTSLVPSGVLQNISGLVQSAAGSLAPTTKSHSDVYANQAAGPYPAVPQATSEVASFFYDPTAARIAPEHAATNASAPHAASQPIATAAEFFSTPLVAAGASPPAPPLAFYNPTQYQLPIAGTGAEAEQTPLPINQQQTSPAAQLPPPPPCGSTSFRLQKGTRLYKHPAVQTPTTAGAAAATAFEAVPPSTIASPVLDQRTPQPAPPANLQIFNPFAEANVVAPGESPTAVSTPANSNLPTNQPFVPLAIDGTQISAPGSGEYFSTVASSSVGPPPPSATSQAVATALNDNEPRTAEDPAATFAIVNQPEVNFLQPVANLNLSKTTEEHSPTGATDVVPSAPQLTHQVEDLLPVEQSNDNQTKETEFSNAIATESVVKPTLATFFMPQTPENSSAFNLFTPPATAALNTTSTSAGPAPTSINYFGQQPSNQTTLLPSLPPRVVHAPSVPDALDVQFLKDQPTQAVPIGSQSLLTEQSVSEIGSSNRSDKCHVDSDAAQNLTTNSASAVNSFSKYFSEPRISELGVQQQQNLKQYLKEREEVLPPPINFNSPIIDSSKFFDNLSSVGIRVGIGAGVGEKIVDGVDAGNESGVGADPGIVISNEDQRIQNFFNNPPPKESNNDIGDLNYDLVHSGLAVKNLEARSQTSVSNLVEPPSSACSEFSELNNSSSTQTSQQPQQQQQQPQRQQLLPQTQTEPQPHPTAPAGDSTATADSLDKFYDDLPEDIQHKIKMAKHLASEQDAAQMVYTPAVHHWFYKREINSKPVWMPFSHYDSALLETSFTSDDESMDAEAIPVEGGRYDVNINQRTKKPVYWEGEATEVRRCSWFYKGVDSKYVPYDEPTAEMLEAEYKRAAESGVWHQKITLSMGEQVNFHGPSVIVHFHQQQSVDAWGGATQTSTRPRIVKRDLDELIIEQGESQRVDHLLFMVHGIGSACDLKLRTVEEVVDDFREIAQHLIQSHYKNSTEMGVVGRVEVLPISWHSHLHSEELGIDEKLKSITLESIPKLRSFTNDTLLDVLFYTSPTFCQKIMNTVATSLNEVYLKYRSRNPDFNGGVSLSGHSLGSLILFDLLCHQEPIKECEEQNMENPDQHVPRGCMRTIHSDGRDCLPRQVSYTMGPAGTGQPYISYTQLIFQPKKFFALGSPIGMFVTIRGIDKLGLDFRLPTCPGFYNIFHPFDPVAYRIEALVNPDMTGIRPVLIPHHKGRKRMHLELKETMTRVGADIKQRFLETFKTTLGSVNFLTSTATKSKKEAEETMEKEVNSVLQMQMHFDQQQQQQQQNNDNASQASSSQAATRTRTDSVSTTVSDSDMVEIDFSMGKLNDSKRVDYVLQEAPLEFINEYIFALSSHVCYWESEDTILFVMKEIYAGLGISPDSQVPQQSMTIERPNSRNSVSQTLLPL